MSAHLCRFDSLNWRTKLLLLTVIYVALVVSFKLIYYSQGYRAGAVNKLSKRGLIFRTWEGTLNIGGDISQGFVEAETWHFSVRDEKLVKDILLAQGNGGRVQLKYREDFIVFPWEGDSRYYIVGVFGGKKYKEVENG